VVGGRNLDDSGDLFLAFDAQSGDALWEVGYPAPGALDYGNSPRATPLITDDFVYLAGAFGQVNCVDRELGLVIWERNLAADFGTPPLDWGLAGSPILVDDRLIVQPGGSRGSIVALDPYTGENVWLSGTAPPGHSSLIVMDVADRRVVIGYDRFTLGAWDIRTGERVWSHQPPEGGDFNVPTPLVCEDRLLLATENNGTRLHALRDDGSLDPAPIATFPSLSPDSHTPVVSNGKVFGVSGELYCLDADSLAPLWSHESREFRDYASLIASDKRVLCLTLDATLLLIDSTADEYREVGRLSLTEGRQETLSHPAWCQGKLYVRLGTRLVCLTLEAAP
jgi:outer membrane protein assembly factor BamB